MLSESAQLLVDFVKSSGEPYGFEPSVKMHAGRLLEDRFLLTIHKAHLAESQTYTADGMGDVTGLMEHLNAHESLIQQFRDLWPNAILVHLGFEAGKDTAEGDITKVYLEFTEQGEERKSSLIHRAFKWQPNKPANYAVTDYSLQEELEETRLIEIIKQNMPQALHEGMLTLISSVLENTDINELMLLNVSETGSPRQSFDLNLYNAEVYLKDYRNQLGQIANSMQIPDTDWNEFMAKQQDRQLGHISAGLTRNREPFVTLYFGVEGRY